ncbi:unnamed protein product [Clonostachys rosea]|uniref:F-box domain-containing protein n=1 Tax=Bionectria ochroleuca TaxID=29856 RepID=A0ABY6ULK1_BIOOC|nr:unnamed protein product [Clonostachys rosea]
MEVTLQSKPIEAPIQSVPAEVLLQVFGYLPSKSDISSVRLVCRLFSDVARSFLGTKATFALVPESIARLDEISSHPFFSQHITTIAFVVNVFRPFDNHREWRHAMSCTLQYPYGTPPEIDHSREDWGQSWGHYRKLLAAQDAAFKSIEPSQEVEIACKRFSKLQNLEIRHYDRATPPPHHLCNNPAFKPLNRRHGDFSGCWALPVYEPGFFSPKLTIPGVYMVSSMLSATSETQLRSLRIDALAMDIFDGECEVYSQLMKIAPHLSTLDLLIYVKHEQEGFQGWFPNHSVLANKRARRLICSASNLEDLKLGFFSVFHNRGYPFYAEAKSFVPRGQAWPRLRRVYLSNVEVVTFMFMDFLVAHIQTLKVLELGNCLMIDNPEWRQEEQPCIWSDFFIPMVTTFPIEKLSLFGRFKLIKPPGRGLQENPNLFVNPPTIYAHDVVQDVAVQDKGLTVGRTVEMIVSSSDFNSFLEFQVGGNLDLVLKLKEEIIQDLLDYYVLKREKEDSVAIPTRHVDYLKSYVSGGSY